jgi:hypothetical protein
MRIGSRRRGRATACGVLFTLLTGLATTVGPVAEAADDEAWERRELDVQATYRRGGRLTVDTPPGWTMREGGERGTDGFLGRYLKLTVIGPRGQRFELFPMFGFGEPFRNLVDHAVSDHKRKSYRALDEVTWRERDDRGRNAGTVRLFEFLADGTTVLSGAVQSRELTLAVRGDGVAPSEVAPIVEILKRIRLVDR